MISACDSAAYLIIENRTDKISNVDITFYNIDEYDIGSRSVDGDSVFIYKYVNTQSGVYDKTPLSLSEETKVTVRFDDSLNYSEMELFLAFGSRWSSQFIDYLSNAIKEIEITIGDETEKIEGKENIKLFLQERAPKGRLVLLSNFHESRNSNH
jgi:hypothetical protein